MISHYALWRATKSWRRTSRAERWIIHIVLILVTLSTSLYAHDIWYFGTLPVSAVSSILTGTAVEAFEPLLVLIVATIVQVTLVFRASRVRPNPIILATR